MSDCSSPRSSSSCSRSSCSSSSCYSSCSSAVEYPDGTLVFNKFIVGGTLGTGAFSSVLSVTDEKSGDQYALKLIKESLEWSFVTECTALDRLKDVQGVVKRIPTFDLAILMPLYDQGTSDEYLRRMIQCMDVSEYFFIHTLNYLLRAVIEFNNRGVVHGDIKPQNILVDDNSQFIIADFGISRLLDPGQISGISDVDMYTPWYRFPKYETDQNYYSVVTDVWALMVSMLELVSIQKNMIFSTNELFRVFRFQIYNSQNSQNLIDNAIDGVFRIPTYATFYKKWLNIIRIRHILSHFDEELRNQFVSELLADLGTLLIR